MIAARLAARALHVLGPVCFACGRRGERPCPGHEYGGTIGAYRLRRWAPWWLAGPIDPRWSGRPLVRDHWYRTTPNIAGERDRRPRHYRALPAGACAYAGCGRPGEAHLRWVGEWTLPRWQRWRIMAARIWRNR